MSYPVERKDGPDIRYCVRCGILESEVKRNSSYGCGYYGVTHRNHSYITDRELEKWSKENDLDFKLKEVVTAYENRPK